MRQNKVKTSRYIRGQTLLAIESLLLILVVGIFLSTKYRVIIVPQLVGTSLLGVIFVFDLCLFLLWGSRNHLNKGLIYAIRYYAICLSIRRALLDADYFVSRQFFGTAVALLPKIRLTFIDNYKRATLSIENRVKYVQRLDNVQLSSALRRYVVERSFLSDDENFYEFELFDSRLERRLTFTSADALVNCGSSLEYTELFIDKFTKVPLHHALIVGQTGSGKTYGIYSLLLQMLSKPIRCQLFLADPKGSSLSILGDIIAPEQTAENSEAIIDLLRAFNDEMSQRKVELKQLLSEKLEATYSDFGLSPFVFVFDEYASFQSAVQAFDKKRRDEVNKLITQIVLQGRQLGFFLVVVMQKSDSSSLPTMIRENLPLKIVLGNAEAQTYVTAFGTGVDIPSRDYRKGEGVFTYPGIANTPKICAFSYLDFDINAAFLAKRGLCNNPRSSKGD